MTETATRTSCRGLGEAGSVAEPTTATTRRLPPFFRPLLTLLGIREQEQEVVSSSDGAGASALPPPSSGPSRRRQSDDRPNTDRMGNCLKSPTSDDVSLLREGPPSSNTVNDPQIEGQSPPAYIQDNTPVYYPSPNVSRPASQLTEEEQVKIAQRMGLIQHLPIGTYDGCKKNRECVICMIEFSVGDPVRYLPCMHTYHTDCIDDWLMRSFTCPSCMEPVDAALLVTYETHWWNSISPLIHNHFPNIIIIPQLIRGKKKILPTFRRHKVFILKPFSP